LISDHGKKERKKERKIKVRRKRCEGDKGAYFQEDRKMKGVLCTKGLKKEYDENDWKKAQRRSSWSF
jgi:hypothetical protein